MHRIIYASTATQDFSQAELKRLLVGARLRNAAAEVTGMLMFHRSEFLQALEGEEAGVAEIFARIESDPRYCDIAILHRATAPGGRVFGEWAMGYSEFTGAAAILKGFVPIYDRVDVRSLDRKRATELLLAGNQEARKTGTAAIA